MKAKVILWPRKNANGDQALMVRISNGNTHVYRSLKVAIPGGKWNDKKQTLRSMKPDDSKEYADYLTLKTRINEIEGKYLETIKTLNHEGREVTIGQLIQLAENPVLKNTVFSYFNEIIGRFKVAHRINNAAVYRQTMLSLKTFNKGSDMKFHDINVRFLSKWEDSIRIRGKKDTTISVYFRTLRSLYNMAIGEGFARQSDYPFGKKSDNSKYTITKLNHRTEKRAITREQIELIETMELPAELDQARKYFMFSYYAAGINFNDIAKLTWQNFNKDRITYTRTKTQTDMDTFLPPYCLQMIHEMRFQRRVDPENYIFEILNRHTHKTPEQIDNRIKKVLKQVNADLKIIGRKAGIKDSLSTYTARHSFISIAANSGEITPFDLQTIVGHTKIETTMIYYKQAGQAHKDQLMRKLFAG